MFRHCILGESLRIADCWPDCRLRCMGGVWRSSVAAIRPQSVLYHRSRSQPNVDARTRSLQPDIPTSDPRATGYGLRGFSPRLAQPKTQSELCEAEYAGPVPPVAPVPLRPRLWPVRFDDSSRVALLRRLRPSVSLPAGPTEQVASSANFIALPKADKPLTSLGNLGLVLGTPYLPTWLFSVRPAPVHLVASCPTTRYYSTLSLSSFSPSLRRQNSRQRHLPTSLGPPRESSETNRNSANFGPSLLRQLIVTCPAFSTSPQPNETNRRPTPAAATHHPANITTTIRDCCSSFLTISCHHQPPPLSHRTPLKPPLQGSRHHSR